MQTGRNVNILSWAIIIYLLGGAKIQSLGVSGVGLKFQNTDIIEIAAVALWGWMILAHWLTRKQGEYYEAWCRNAKHHAHPGMLQAEQQESEDPEEFNRHIRCKIEAHFAKKLLRETWNHEFRLSYVDTNEYPSGVYVTIEREQRAPRGPDPKNAVYEPQTKVYSQRYSTLHLHEKFPDVIWKVLLNDGDVFLRRVVPWVSGVIAAGLLAAICFVDVSMWLSDDCTSTAISNVRLNQDSPLENMAKFSPPSFGWALHSEWNDIGSTKRALLAHKDRPQS